jgi:hypothetical protein
LQARGVLVKEALAFVFPLQGVFQYFANVHGLVSWSHSRIVF